MATNDNLIVTAGFNYSPEQLRPFLKSASRHIPNADVVIFSDNNDSRYMESIIRLHARARIVVPEGYKFKDYLWKHKKLRKFVKSIGLDKLRKYLPSPTRQQISRIHRSSFLHIQLARYSWAHSFLGELDPKPKMVLLADSRDVYFQGDPFEDNQQSILCGEEPMTIGSCPINSNWIETSYRKKILQEIKDRPVLCSGVTLGNYADVYVYADAMVSDIENNALKLVGKQGSDQGIHNKILHLNKDITYSTSRNGDELIATLHSSDLREFNFREAQGLLTKDGRPVKIVHQYDRHEKLREWVRETYG